MDALSGKPSGDEAVADAHQINSIVALVPAADNEVRMLTNVLLLVRCYVGPHRW